MGGGGRIPMRRTHDNVSGCPCNHDFDLLTKLVEHSRHGLASGVPSEVASVYVGSLRPLTVDVRPFRALCRGLVVRVQSA